MAVYCITASLYFTLISMGLNSTKLNQITINYHEKEFFKLRCDMTKFNVMCRASKSAPMATEEFTSSLEDMIIKRIR